MSIKISDTSPANIIASGLSSLSEEAVATASSCLGYDTIAPAPNARPRHEPDCLEAVIGGLITAVFGVCTLVADIVWDFLWSTFDYLYDTVVCIFGGRPNNGNIAPEALAATRFYKLNRSRLSEVPRRVALDVDTSNAMKHVKIDQLITEFDKVANMLNAVTTAPAHIQAKLTTSNPHRGLFGRVASAFKTIDGQFLAHLQSYLTQEHYRAEPLRAAKRVRTLSEPERQELFFYDDVSSYITTRTNLMAMKEYVATHKADADELQRRQTAGQELDRHSKQAIFEGQQMHEYLLSLVFTCTQIQNQNNKRAAFQGLADAYHGCGPHKYKAIRDQFERLTDRAPDLNQLWLLATKQLKQNILLSRYQTSQFHVINAACSKVSDWGLDPDQAELGDSYIDVGGGAMITGLNVRYTLNKEFTPARALTAFKSRLDDLDDQSLITVYTRTHRDALPADWAENYNETFTYRDSAGIQREGTRINYHGAAWLAWHLGWFNSAMPVL